MKYVKFFAVLTAGLIFSYLTGCFMFADFNIATWEPFGRFLIGLLGSVLSLYSAATVTILD